MWGSGFYRVLGVELIQKPLTFFARLNVRPLFCGFRIEVVDIACLAAFNLPLSRAFSGAFILVSTDLLQLFECRTNLASDC